jgi:CTP synthase
MVSSGTSPDGLLEEAVENPSCDFFVGVQYHPECQSGPDRPHPLFSGFVGACMKKTGA